MAKQTRGEHLIGVSFNPSGLSVVDELKGLGARMIDLIDDLSLSRDKPGAREASIAITNIEQATMWAVKAVTKQPPNPDEGDPIGEQLQRHADETTQSSD